MEGRNAPDNTEPVMNKLQQMFQERSGGRGLYPPASLPPAGPENPYPFNPHSADYVSGELSYPGAGVSNNPPHYPSPPKQAGYSQGYPRSPSQPFSPRKEKTRRPLSPAPLTPSPMKEFPRRPFPERQPAVEQFPEGAPARQGQVKPVLLKMRKNAGAYAACPTCNQEQLVVKYSSGTFTWLMCFLLGLLTLCLCWIPFVCDVCKDEDIVCTNCRILVHREKRLG